MERDKFGKFTKGHQFVPAPAGARAGSPRALKSEVKEALNVAEEAMPQIIQAMVLRATAGPDECPAAVRQAAAQYLVDRLYGKATDHPPATDLIVNVISHIPRPAPLAPGKTPEVKF